VRTLIQIKYGAVMQRPLLIVFVLIKAFLLSIAVLLFSVLAEEWKRTDAEFWNF
jgi:hypothetical protein